jgi:hypothetical protein
MPAPLWLSTQQNLKIYTKRTEKACLFNANKDLLNAILSRNGLQYVSTCVLHMHKALSNKNCFIILWVNNSITVWEGTGSKNWKRTQITKVNYYFPIDIPQRLVT